MSKKESRSDGESRRDGFANGRGLNVTRAFELLQNKYIKENIKVISASLFLPRSRLALCISNKKYIFHTILFWKIAAISGILKIRQWDF